MKQIALYISAVVLLAACNNAGEQKNIATEEQPAAETTEPKTGAKLDPICEMEKDSTWTDYTVYNSDTVWFCSEVCKGVFLKNPDKYAAKLK